MKVSIWEQSMALCSLRCTVCIQQYNCSSCVLDQTATDSNLQQIYKLLNLQLADLYLQVSSEVLLMSCAIDLGNERWSKHIYSDRQTAEI